MAKKQHLKPLFNRCPQYLRIETEIKLVHMCNTNITLIIFAEGMEWKRCDIFRTVLWCRSIPQYSQENKASSHPLISWQQSLCTLPHPNRTVFAQFLSLLLNHIFYLHFLFFSIIIICQKWAREIQQKDILYTVIKQAKNLSKIKGNDCSVLETTTVQNLVWTTLYLGTFHRSFPPRLP